MAEQTGVTAAAAGLQDTGVTVPAAGGQEVEYPTQADIEAMQLQDEPEDTEPEPTIDEILGREEAPTQTVVKEGVDNPPAPTTEPNPAEPGSPNQPPELPENASKAFSERLKAERVKIAREEREAAKAEFQQLYGVTPEEAAELKIEKRARELMTKYPERVGNDIEFAKELARAQMQVPAAQQQAQQPAAQQTSSNPERVAWVESIKAQEAAMRTVDPNFSFVDHFNNNPAFKASVLTGGSIRDALAAEAQETVKSTQQIEAAKRQGKQEAVDAIRNSGSAAMAPVPQGKGQRPNTKPMTEAELFRFNEYVKTHGSAPNPYYHG
jgi:hypothetical protein